MSSDLVILLHGFHRNALRMQPMAEDFRSRGYRVLVPNMPSTKGRLNTCVQSLANSLGHAGIFAGQEPVVHLVGHSYGGLIARGLLAQNVVPGLASLTCMGSTHLGSRIADVMVRLGMQRWQSALYEFRTPGPRIPPPLQGYPPKVQLIAGNINKLWWGRFLLPPESDGRLTIASALAIGAAGDAIGFPAWIQRSILDLDHHQLMDPGPVVDAIVAGF